MMPLARAHTEKDDEAKVFWVTVTVVVALRVAASRRVSLYRGITNDGGKRVDDRREQKDGDTNATKEDKETTTKAPHDALALRWEVCAHRIVIGLEQMTRAERDQRPLDAQMVAKKCLRKN